METTVVTTQTNVGTLAVPLQSAAFVPMDSIKGKVASAGNRFCKLIKKGENSKLSNSLAVEVPAIAGLADYSRYPAITAYLVDAMQSLQAEAVKAIAISGAKIVQFSDLSIDKLEVVAAALNESSGIGQLSEERIKSWFNSDCRELVIVALADRLGMGEAATDADIKRLEQIANQMQGNLAKLASRKPVQFDERVKKALNMALDVSDTGDNMTIRLREKLNQVIGADDMLMNLGL